MSSERYYRNLRTILDNLEISLDKAEDKLGEAIQLLDNHIINEEGTIIIKGILYDIKDILDNWSKYSASYRSAYIIDHDKLEFENDKLMREVDKLKREIELQNNLINKLGDKLEDISTIKTAKLLDLIESKTDLIANSEGHKIKVSKQGHGKDSFKYKHQTDDNKLISLYVNAGYKLTKQVIEQMTIPGGVATYQGLKNRLVALNVWRGRQ